MTKVLYISYDGMTDPLGQSQVIPYLAGLSEMGYKFQIISCEKKEKFITNENNIKNLLLKHNIEWYPISYTKYPSVLSTIWNIIKIRRKATFLHRKENFSIIHCRSYIASLAGLRMKKKYGIKFIFDMRGFWADERVEGGLWNRKNPLFNIIYSWFKKKEAAFLTNADYTVSLTETGKKEIHSWKHIAGQPIPIQVIPCCVDTELFNPDRIDKEQQKMYKKKLGINDTELVLSYLGSLGTWYVLDEMLLFFKQLLNSKPNSKFLFITHEREKTILTKAKELQINPEKIIIQKAKREEVPLFLSLSRISIFFIKPTFSKKASSPTKQGEIMSMGIPIISNEYIGDMQKTIKISGVAVQQFNTKEYNRIIQKIDAVLALPPQEIIHSAIEIFSLKKGVEAYNITYQRVLEK